MVVKGRPRSRPPLGCERLGTRLRRTRRRRHLTRSPTVGSGRHHPSAGERDLSTAELAGDNGVERLHRQRLKRDDASQTKQAFRKVTDGVLLLSCTRTDCGTKDRPGERRMTAYERPLEECDGLVLPYRVHELPRVDLSWVVEDVGSPPQSAEGVAHPAPASYEASRWRSAGTVTREAPPHDIRQNDACEKGPHARLAGLVWRDLHLLEQERGSHLVELPARGFVRTFLGISVEHSASNHRLQPADFVAINALASNRGEDGAVVPVG